MAWRLAKLEPTIPLATVHGWTGHSREKFYYSVDKRILRSLPCLIAVSGQIRQTLLDSGVRDERIHTILNGIDAYVFHRDRLREKAIRDSLGISDHEIVIGAAGRLEPQKRFDILLEAFARVRLGRPEMRLLIAGEGGERAGLKADILRRGLENSCRLLGHRTDIVELHHAFDLFAQSSDYEGTPNAV